MIPVLTKYQERALKCVSGSLKSSMINLGIDSLRYRLSFTPKEDGGIDIAVINLAKEAIAGTIIGPILTWNALAEATFTTVGATLAERVKKCTE